MEFDVTDVLAELKNLRKGYGVEDPGATARIGGALRHVAGVTDDDGPAEQRRKLKARLLALTEALPDGMAEVSRRALALDGAHSARFELRLEQVATGLHRDVRTARRRVDAVLQRLAEEALATARSAVPSSRETPWHVGALKVLVLLDTPVVEVIEERQVISHRDGLTEIDHSYSVAPDAGGDQPADPAGLGVAVLRGGILHSPELLSTTRLGFRVQLPHPLDAGQGHDLSFRVWVNGAAAPFYVCTPRYPCRRFDLTVRFGRDQRPNQVWVLDDELPLEVGDSSLIRKGAEPDASGEVRVSFADLETNRSYGLGWEPVLR